MEQKIEEQLKPIRGGVRANAGRKKKYGEETKVLTLRVPESQMEDLKKAIKILISCPQYVQDILGQSMCGGE